MYMTIARRVRVGPCDLPCATDRETERMGRTRRLNVTRAVRRIGRKTIPVRIVLREAIMPRGFRRSNTSCRSLTSAGSRVFVVMSL